MLNVISSVFKRYVSKHAEIQKPGFPLIDTSGHRFGYVDRITVKEGRLWVEGWSLSRFVGLANVHHASKISPNLSREDVLKVVGSTAVKTPGFVLNMPLHAEHTVFWSEVDGVRYVNVLPSVSTKHLYRAQVIPFIRDVVKVLPHCARWAVRRDFRSVAYIKTALNLNTVPRSGQLESGIFPKGIRAQDAITSPASSSGITIIVPIYNALDLLPEVLSRVINNTDLPWRLVLVEDCSSDPEVRPWLRAWKRSLDPAVADRVTVIENEKNLGFIRSVNRAFDFSIPFGDHVVLLNSDAFVPAKWASRLVRPILNDNSVATVTPMSNDAEIFNVPVICGRENLLPGEADIIDEVASRFPPEVCLAEAPTGVGFCMMINIDYLRKDPQLDTVFGRGYGEEVDWCQRVRQKGGRHLGIGSLFVEHRGGTSFGSAEKLKLVQKNNQVVSSRYPQYDEEVQNFIRADPMKTSRLSLGMAWASVRQKGSVPVYLAHDMGGGAENYLQERIREDLKDDAAAVVLRVGGMSRWQVELHSRNGITRGETDDSDFVYKLLGLLRVRKVIYSCAVGDRDPVRLPEFLMSLANGPQDEIEVLVHDYFPLSPSYTLLDGEGVYQGVPDPNGQEDPAHSTICAEGRMVDLSAWRDAWGKLLEKASVVSVFSKDSHDLVVQAYPEIATKVKITPHTLISAVPIVKAGVHQDGKPVIGVLGNIGYQKGAGLLRDLSQHLAKSDEARLAVIGNVDPSYPLAGSAHVHGDYRVEDIPNLVSRYGISRWFIPSIWPETFSYTTHEALATGLPVFSFDLGAQGDAVRSAAQTRGQGGVISLEKTRNDLTEMLKVIL